MDAIKSMTGTGSTPSNATRTFMESINKAFDSKQIKNIDIDNLAKQIGHVDENAVKAAKHMQQTSGSIEDFNRTVGAAGTASQEFGEAVKSAVINMGAMLLVMVAIKGAMWIFDKLNVTTEEQQEIVDDLTEKVKGLKDEYNELYGRNDLTEAEKQKLDYLQRQLTVNEQILKQEQKKLGTVIFLIGQFVPFEFSKLA